jgi:phosphatidylinositol phosphate synthase
VLGSVDVATRDRPAVGYGLLALILVAAAAAAALVLTGHWAAAGVSTAVSAGAVTVSGRRAKYTADERLTYADSAAERTADAVVLGALAWATAGEPLVAGGALSALVLGYLAAYLRAKATGLGFPIEESLIARAVRVALIVLGLITVSALGAALWAASTVSLFSVIREAVEVSRREEPA